MTGSYSGRFSLKSICMLLCVLIGMSFALQFVEVHDVYAAGMWSNAYGESDPDEAYIESASVFVGNLNPLYKIMFAKPLPMPISNI